MLTIEKLANDKTDYSTTRWAFCMAVWFDIIVISLVVIFYFVCNLCGKEVNNDIFNGVSILLGILTTLTATPKILQGFEPKNGDENVSEEKGE